MLLFVTTFVFKAEPILNEKNYDPQINFKTSNLLQL
jgi:hypothetical protein